MASSSSGGIDRAGVSMTLQMFPSTKLYQLPAEEYDVFDEKPIEPKPKPEDPLIQLFKTVCLAEVGTPLTWKFQVQSKKCGDNLFSIIADVLNLPEASVQERFNSFIDHNQGLVKEISRLIGREMGYKTSKSGKKSKSRGCFNFKKQRFDSDFFVNKILVSQNGLKLLNKCFPPSGESKLLVNAWIFPGILKLATCVRCFISARIFDLDIELSHVEMNISLCTSSQVTERMQFFHRVELDSPPSRLSQKIRLVHGFGLHHDICSMKLDSFYLQPVIFASKEDSSPLIVPPRVVDLSLLYRKPSAAPIADEEEEE